MWAILMSDVTCFLVSFLFFLVLVALFLAIYQCLKSYRIERLANELWLKQRYTEIFIHSLSEGCDCALVKSQLMDTFTKEHIPFTFEEIDKLIESVKQEDSKGG